MVLGKVADVQHAESQECTLSREWNVSRFHALHLCGGEDRFHGMTNRHNEIRVLPKIRPKWDGQWHTWIFPCPCAGVVGLYFRIPFREDLLRTFFKGWVFCFFEEDINWSGNAAIIPQQIIVQFLQGEMFKITIFVLKEVFRL